MTKTFQKIIACGFFIAYIPTLSCEFSLNALSSWWFNSTQKTYNKTFETTEATSLSVDNLQGSLTVRTWTEPKIALDVVIAGKEKEINDIIIHTQEAPNGHITIRTEQLSPASNKATADYAVMIPENMAASLTTSNGNIAAEGTQGALKATTQQGNITITQTRGSVHATTHQGSIDIAYSYLPQETVLQATCDNGSITLALPPTADAHVAAKTEKGFITTQQTVLLKPQLTQLGRQAWRQFKQQAFFTLGQGGATISLFTKNGTIKITEQ